jgi:hypothetical protein
VNVTLKFLVAFSKHRDSIVLESLIDLYVSVSKLLDVDKHVTGDEF